MVAPSLVDVITATRSQGCTVVRSLVQSLDHRVSDAIYSNANLH